MLVKRGRCAQCGWICCSPCEHLLPDGRCDYEEKPEGCRKYPHNPMALEPGCNYYFEEVDPSTGTVLEKITAENLGGFPEEKRQFWLMLSIEKSLDE